MGTGHTKNGDAAGGLVVRTGFFGALARNMERHLLVAAELTRLDTLVSEYRDQVAELDQTARELTRLRERMALLAALVRLDGLECRLPWEPQS